VTLCIVLIGQGLHLDGLAAPAVLTGSRVDRSEDKHACTQPFKVSAPLHVVPHRFVSVLFS
jgi:hypothetical protein